MGFRVLVFVVMMMLIMRASSTFPPSLLFPSPSTADLTKDVRRRLFFLSAFAHQGTYEFFGLFFGSNAKVCHLSRVCALVRQAVESTIMKEGFYQMCAPCTLHSPRSPPVPCFEVL